MADVVITKEVATEDGIDLEITDLEFEVKLDFDNTSSARRELEVVVADGLTPVITLSQVDVNGRQDGQGHFTRLFPPFAQVTLQAPGRFGEFRFERWLVKGQLAPTTNTIVSLTLASATRAEPLFRRDAQAFVLTPTPISLSGGQMGFSFPSVAGARYTIEQTLRIGNPNWTISETRTGDGLPLQFTRPFSANTGVFFRVRVD